MIIFYFKIGERKFEKLEPNYFVKCNLQNLDKAL